MATERREILHSENQRGSAPVYRFESWTPDQFFGKCADQKKIVLGETAAQINHGGKSPHMHPNFMKRFALVDEDHQTIIRDVEHGLNVFFLAGGGLGVDTSTRNLGERVVDYLNSLPANETLLYPFNRT